ncbi:MAG: hypothetical protein ACKVY0_24130 [Prosthecobacter sp.]|uniref:hypothetical protein n=1 Tax=Prosthecobacter sp. TaxID=1965333 RepID=UPI00390160A9
MESPADEGHSRRVAAALHARVLVVLEPTVASGGSSVLREESAAYKVTKRSQCADDAERVVSAKDLH